MIGRGRRVFGGPGRAGAKGQGDAPAALPSLERALAAHPEEPTLLLLKAQVLERRGHYLEARRLYARVVRRDTSNVFAAIHLGHSYYYAGRPALAVRWYDRAVALLREDHSWPTWRAECEEAHWFRAWALTELGRRHEALVCVRRGLAQVPRSRALRDLLASLRALVAAASPRG